jgi:hypothetical protein
MVPVSYRLDQEAPMRVSVVLNVLCGFVLSLFSICSAETPATESAMETARRLLEAFNRHDPDAMASLVSDDFELYYVGDDGTAALALRGPKQLAEEMRGYFAHNTGVRSTVVGVVDGPVFVSFREQIAGGASSIAVYEVREQRIKRVWYFPAEKTDAGTESSSPD